MMDHLRGCDDCKSRFDFHTRAVMTVRRPSTEQPALESPRDTAQEAPAAPTKLRYTRYDHDDVVAARERRPGRARGWMALLLLVAIFAYAFQSRSEAFTPEAETDAEVFALLALGDPVAWHPHAALKARPRVLVVWLPVGTKVCTLRFSSAGERILDHPVQIEDPGVIALEREVAEGKQRVQGLRVTIPMLAEASLPLAAGQTYEWRVLLPEGRTSAPATFRIDP